MVNLVPHVKQDMYSVGGCSFNVCWTVNVMEQSEVRRLKRSIKRHRRVMVDIVLMSLWDAGTFRKSIQIELCIRYF